MGDVIAIFYTTKYRLGGPQFVRAADTLAQEKKIEFPNHSIQSHAVESKQALINCLKNIGGQQQKILELHFIGHSGMYGPMFGTIQWPEQFSPYEWQQLSIPFAEEARAYFHSCRSARWFAPFFAKIFRVPTYGYHWYTTVSKSPHKFVWEGFRKKQELPLYLIGYPGKKSHGLVGAALKFSGLAKSEALKRFEPAPIEGDATYNSVAELYDKVFEDIGVRVDEWNWLQKHLPKNPQPRVLDIGCGNGALLKKIADRIKSGVGLDKSEQMIRLARKNNQGHDKLQFKAIEGPQLPLEDHSIDVVISLLSFRYLDWDPILREIKRVLAPGGKLLIVDMVTTPVKWKEVPKFIWHKTRQTFQSFRQRRFMKHLKALVQNPAWKEMLKYNPIRSEHEFQWYAESRFAGQKMERLNIGWHHRVVAFDSGPLQPGEVEAMTYP